MNNSEAAMIGLDMGASEWRAAWVDEGETRVLPHRFASKRWAPFIEKRLLPEDVVAALNRAALRPRAATCSDRQLLLVLSRYDAGGERLCRVEELSPGMLFETESGRRFVLGTRLRSRYRCLEVTTGAEYRVHGLARVARVDRD